MVATTTLVLGATALASGTALALLLVRLLREARGMDGSGSRRLAIALGLLTGYVVIRVVQAAGLGTANAVFFVRNAFWGVAWALALSVVLEFPGTTRAHRTAAWILPLAAMPAAFLTPFWVNVLAHYFGLGALGATLAVLAWRLEGNSAAPGVRGLALTGAGLAVLAAWVDGLVLGAASRGDRGLFTASRIFADTVFVTLALFARPALRERPQVPPPAAVAPQATGP